MPGIHLAPVLLASTIGLVAAGPAAPPRVWTRDGVRSCTFDAADAPVRCVQSHMVIRRRLKTGAAWKEYHYRWQGPRGSEVRYSSRIGLVGVSRFTIGDLVDLASDLPDHRSHHAVSYVPGGDKIVIGVPGEGYEFTVEGGGF